MLCAYLSGLIQWRNEIAHILAHIVFWMVNFEDPAVVANDGFALLKFWLVVDGIFLWEYFTTLDFEWNIIRGHRRYRWTIWVYSLLRLAALATLITDLVLLNLTTPYDCQFSETLALVFSFLALAAASLLLMLRIVAIWNRNAVAVGIAAIIWVNDCAFFIQGIARLRFERVFPGGYCTLRNVQAMKAAITVSFLSDVALLIIMLVGLFRLDCHRPGALATGRFLWNQGVIWLLVATVAGVVPTVFSLLNLNEPLSSMFLFPWVMTLTIASTRMYRGLDDFLSSDVLHHVSHVPYRSGRNIPDSVTRGTSAMPVPLDGIAVNVHTHSLTSQAIRPDSLGNDMDKQPEEKSHELV
ncbi:hypothetical protein BJV77DRAFT_548923 [Russula vinacea]|nr:hypothetical protein BJV77DRAFT_548923 [Russula vinacea]